MTKKEIGNYVLNKRMSLGWSQGKLAQEAGLIRRQAILEIEKGDKNYTIDVLIKVLDALSTHMVLDPITLEPNEDWTWEVDPKLQPFPKVFEPTGSITIEMKKTKKIIPKGVFNFKEIESATEEPIEEIPQTKQKNKSWKKETKTNLKSDSQW